MKSLKFASIALTTAMALAACSQGPTAPSTGTVAVDFQGDLNNVSVPVSAFTTIPNSITGSVDDGEQFTVPAGSYTFTLPAQIVVGGVTYVRANGETGTDTVTVVAGQSSTVSLNYVRQQNNTTTGTLATTITGVTGVTVSGTLTSTSAGSQPQTITLGTPVANLAPGTYTLTVANVASGGTTYAPAQTSYPITITAGQTTTQNIVYTAQQNNPVNNANIAIVLTGVSSTNVTIRTTGTTPTTVFQGTAGTGSVIPVPAGTYDVVVDQTVNAGGVQFTIPQANATRRVTVVANGTASAAFDYTRTVTPGQVITGITLSSVTDAEGVALPLVPEVNSNKNVQIGASQTEESVFVTARVTGANGPIANAVLFVDPQYSALSGTSATVIPGHVRVNDNVATPLKTQAVGGPVQIVTDANGIARFTVYAANGRLEPVGGSNDPITGTISDIVKFVVSGATVGSDGSVTPGAALTEFKMFFQNISHLYAYNDFVDGSAGDDDSGLFQATGRRTGTTIQLGRAAFRPTENREAYLQTAFYQKQPQDGLFVPTLPFRSKLPQVAQPGDTTDDGIIDDVRTGYVVYQLNNTTNYFFSGGCDYTAVSATGTGNFSNFASSGQFIPSGAFNTNLNGASNTGYCVDVDGSGVTLGVTNSTDLNVINNLPGAQIAANVTATYVYTQDFGNTTYAFPLKSYNATRTLFGAALDIVKSGPTVITWAGSNANRDDVTLPATGSAAKNYTYTITVRNTNANPITNVVVTDELPAELGYVSSPAGGTYDPVLHEVTFTQTQVPALASLAANDNAPGGADEVTLTVTVYPRHKPGYVWNDNNQDGVVDGLTGNGAFGDRRPILTREYNDPYQVTNSVVVTSAEAAEDRADFDINVVRPFIAIDKRQISPSGTLRLNDQVTYRITASNIDRATLGDSGYAALKSSPRTAADYLNEMTAYSARIVDSFGTQIDYVNSNLAPATGPITQNPGSVNLNDRTVTFDLGNLALGQTRTATTSFRANETGVFDDVNCVQLFANNLNQRINIPLAAGEIVRDAYPFYNVSPAAIGGLFTERLSQRVEPDSFSLPQTTRPGARRTVLNGAPNFLADCADVEVIAGPSFDTELSDNAPDAAGDVFTLTTGDADLINEFNPGDNYYKNIRSNPESSPLAEVFGNVNAEVFPIGGTFEYKIRHGNYGDGPATNVRITNALPRVATYSNMNVVLVNGVERTGTGTPVLADSLDLDGAGSGILSGAPGQVITVNVAADGSTQVNANFLNPGQELLFEYVVEGRVAGDDDARTTLDFEENTTGGPLLKAEPTTVRDNLPSTVAFFNVATAAADVDGTADSELDRPVASTTTFNITGAVDQFGLPFNGTVEVSSNNPAFDFTPATSALTTTQLVTLTNGTGSFSVTSLTPGSGQIYVNGSGAAAYNAVTNLINFRPVLTSTTIVDSNNATVAGSVSGGLNNFTGLTPTNTYTFTVQAYVDVDGVAGYSAANDYEILAADQVKLDAVLSVPAGYAQGEPVGLNLGNNFFAIPSSTVGTVTNSATSGKVTFTFRNTSNVSNIANDITFFPATSGNVVAPTQTEPTLRLFFNSTPIIIFPGF
ncbi:DUF11 domain-containing protein [Deinococcus yavapaiensis]|uniref:Uncharacterized protein DUF11 n=1 Tax=Deinococcus yavapaiensis KR-236 TaxID=694435 RepID=A0A318S3T6_9DEIO|nr:DUF11 domain-containing protein [Deinococcus yavapaiensis]PYE51107.1 uncharacterized protein DUF11 [Deinococcus yavapaiensis KR-236]